MLFHRTITTYRQRATGQILDHPGSKVVAGPDDAPDFPTSLKARWRRVRLPGGREAVENLRVFMVEDLRNAYPGASQEQLAIAINVAMEPFQRSDVGFPDLAGALIAGRKVREILGPPPQTVLATN